MTVLGTVVLLIVLLAVGLALKAWVDHRGLSAAGGAGDRLMAGRAAKHVALLDRTLLVRAAPDAVTAAVAPVLADHSRWALFHPAEPSAGEHAAWTTTSYLTPGQPRLAVRPSTAPGWSEFGVVTYAWSQRFPQGGRFTARVLPRCLDAVRGAGLMVVEARREFTVPPTGPTSDGLRTALPLAPPASGQGGPVLEVPS